MAEWWEKWRGGIKAGGRRGEVGGRMNRRKKGVGCCVVLRERAVPCCRGVCLCFFYMNAFVTVHVFFLMLTPPIEEAANKERKLVGLFKKNINVRNSKSGKIRGNQAGG